MPAGAPRHDRGPGGQGPGQGRRGQGPGDRHEEGRSRRAGRRRSRLSPPCSPSGREDQEG
ncbi:MAG: hypothetical protein MZV64_14390 [Ignavibacteriales bacterium]|nr:hypothetical protein [Ignavibacteriales bacterium]